jgi:glutaredoxin-like protein
MSILSPADRGAVQQKLSALPNPVRLIFFEQTIGCETCTPVRQMLQQIVSLSDKIVLESRNLVLDREEAGRCGIDRVPAIVIEAQSSSGGGRIAFVGGPFGYEFASLIEAIELTSSGDDGLGDETRAVLEALQVPLEIKVFVTPTCAHCPRMVALANRLAVRHASVSAVCIEANEFPDLTRRYRVNGVPKTVINDTVEILGAVAEAELVEAIVSLDGRRASVPGP